MSVGREALESSSAVLQTAARPSQLPAQTKRPGISRRPALKKAPAWRDAGVTIAMDTRVARPVGRRYGISGIRLNFKADLQVVIAASTVISCTVCRYILSPMSHYIMLDEREMQKVRSYSAIFLIKFGFLRAMNLIVTSSS